MEQLNKAQRRIKRLIKRNELIKQHFEQLSSKRIGTARKYSQDAMIIMVADKFFLAEKTVEDIICNRINYKQSPTDEKENTPTEN